MNKHLLLYFLAVFAPWAMLFGLDSQKLYENDEIADLFRQLSMVKKINSQVDDHLPYIFNYTMNMGYMTMPSARTGKAGMTAFGYSYVKPYQILGLNFQMFDHVELGGNYRIYNGVLESGFGDQGFGDDADRAANIKVALYKQGTGLEGLPSFAIGWEDFYGSRRFHSFYVCSTKELLKHNVEVTLGWGKGRIKGFFGGLAWTPFRNSSVSVFKDLSLMAEYDAINYKSHTHEHPNGREVRFPINIGMSANIFDFLQVKASSVRGVDYAASVALYHNLGDTKGFFPKVHNPAFHTAPVNAESIGALRTEKELCQELAFGFKGQGLSLYAVYIYADKKGNDVLWMKIVNNQYREENQLRDRIQYLLSTMMPSNIFASVVVVESDGIPIQAYHYLTADLERFRDKEIGESELEAISPVREATRPPSKYEGTLLYKRKKDTWSITARPRLLTFFGSTTGKLKYSVGFVAGPEGYLMDLFYYKLQLAYNIKSSLSDVGDRDVYNTSYLLNVRSDTVRYYQSNSVSVEQAYVQKGYNVGWGWYTRGALGYFEPAYTGAAFETLFYPVGSNWAFGIEGAGVLKRKYSGLGVTTKIRKFDSQNQPEMVHFIGYQYFLDVYYDYKPWQMDVNVSLGQFLARDRGVRVEVNRYFPSGLRFGIWYTITNAHDKVNGHTYYDKGIAFYIPLDFFLKKSSRSYTGYAMSEWLRDAGARAATGKRLYPIIHQERINLTEKH